MRLNEKLHVIIYIIILHVFNGYCYFVGSSESSSLLKQNAPNLAHWCYYMRTTENYSRHPLHPGTASEVWETRKFTVSWSYYLRSLDRQNPFYGRNLANWNMLQYCSSLCHAITSHLSCISWKSYCVVNNLKVKCKTLSEVFWGGETFFCDVIDSTFTENTHPLATPLLVSFSSTAQEESWRRWVLINKYCKQVVGVVEGCLIPEWPNWLSKRIIPDSCSYWIIFFFFLKIRLFTTDIVFP